ncbi:MAG: acyltransferase [Bacteroidaceae bacterium]|nr:acyltransferase [Bacteroidaceae bacterium]
MNTKPLYDQEQIDVITWLRFPLILGVVFIHTNIYSLVKMWEGASPQWPQWLIYVFNYLYLIVLPEPVPVLFIISGYFFFRNSSIKEQIPFADKLKRRIHSLLIPYLIWNTIAILFLYIRFNVVAHEDYTLTDYISGYWDFSQRHNDDPANGPLWYMRDLMIVSICAPLLYRLLKNNATAILYFAIITTCYITNTGINITGFGGGAFMFFAIGAYIAIHNVNITKIPHPIGITTLALYIPLQLILNNIGDNACAFLVTNIIKITALFYFVSLLYRKRIINPTPGLTKICFMLYALHGIIIGPTIKALYILFDSNNPIVLLFIYFFTPVIMIMIAYVTDKILQTHAPLLGKLITGNRTR